MRSGLPNKDNAPVYQALRQNYRSSIAGNAAGSTWVSASTGWSRRDHGDTKMEFNSRCISGDGQQDFR